MRAHTHTYARKHADAYIFLLQLCYIPSLKLSNIKYEPQTICIVEYAAWGRCSVRFVRPWDLSDRKSETGNTWRNSRCVYEIFQIMRNVRTSYEIIQNTKVYKLKKDLS